MGAPRRSPWASQERPTNPQGSTNHDGNVVFWKCHRNTHHENVHSSLAPGPFWPNRDADRSRITPVGCVFRCGPKSGRGCPKGGAPIFKQQKTLPFLKMCTPLEHQAHFGQRAEGFDANHPKGRGDDNLWPGPPPAPREASKREKFDLSETVKKRSAC